MTLELKDVVEYIVQIRAQGMQLFHILLTVFAGSFLAAVLRDN